MQPNEEYIKMYREAEKANKDFLKKEIVKHLVANCPKFDQERIDGCIKYIETAVSKMLGGRNAAKSVNGVDTLSGAVSSDTVFRMARDYFNDEMWKNEKAGGKAKKKQKAATEPQTEENEETSVPEPEKPAEAAEPQKEKAKDDNDGQLSLFGIEGFTNA